MAPIRLPFVCPVAGVSLRQRVVLTLSVGDEVRIVHEKDNPHDPNAYRISTLDGRQIGYVPAKLAPRLAATGEAFKGEVVELVGGRGAVGVRVKVTAPDLAAGALRDVEAGRPEGRLVVVKSSGRVLGRYLGKAPSGKVLVESRTGAVVPYPADLVSVADSQ